MLPSNISVHSLHWLGLSESLCTQAKAVIVIRRLLPNSSAWGFNEQGSSLVRVRRCNLIVISHQNQFVHNPFSHSSINLVLYWFKTWFYSFLGELSICWFKFLVSAITLSLIRTPLSYRESRNVCYLPSLGKRNLTPIWCKQYGRSFSLDGICLSWTLDGVFFHVVLKDG